jgi:16S rRNA (uracil1498-N3)-methyltransferase
MSLVSVPRFLAPAPEPSATSVTLPPDEAHHLRHVLRLGAGADVQVFDGTGREWAGRVANVTKREVVIEITREVAPVPEPPVHVTLCAGLLKGDQMDAVVRDATMLGVAAIVPLVSAHVSVPKQAWRGGAAVARWQRIAVASARQCGRAVVPVVSAVTPVAAAFGSAGDDLVICVEPALAAGADTHDWPRPRAVRVLVGPEGGWSAEEVAEARRRSARPLSLGPRTLRAESAPIVALSSLWTRWGW